MKRKLLLKFNLIHTNFKSVIVAKKDNISASFDTEACTVSSQKVVRREKLAEKLFLYLILKITYKICFVT